MTDDEVYQYLEQEFEWSRAKAASNAVKHGIRFTEAATVLLDPGAEYFVDETHSSDERRYTVVGWSEKARTLLVVHLWRAQRIRIISARRATPRERRQHGAELD